MFSRSLPLLKNMTSNLATLRVHGPDGKGIVAACSNLLDQRGFAIVGTEHWTDRNYTCSESGDKNDMLFLRIAFDKESSNHIEYKATTTATTATIVNSFQTTTENDLTAFCHGRNLTFDINWRNRKPRVAIMASKYDHCLWELLLRHEAQELDCDIVSVLSNHDTLHHVAETFSIPYHVFPITPATKRDQEQREIQLLQNELNVDLIVLARYMQVLTPEFLQVFPHNQIINIHHSFLPAFSGRRPYHAAHARGVKLIGATAHYTTADLDEGPIIEQSVMDVTHRDGVEGLIRKGRILERNVLVRALEAHLDDRVIVHKNKCVVFGD